ncbi:MAG: hypothetical protein H8E63_06935, partial [Proteobacteria bacterium]|nr:hypothetical protein [Pseudomonadota bacterium]
MTNHTDRTETTTVVDAPSDAVDGMGKTEDVTRIARSMDVLRKRFDAIEAGTEAKPDWFHLQSDCRLDRLAKADLEETLVRMHRCSLRGFKANNVDIDQRTPP